MNVTFTPDQAGVLGERAERLGAGAQEFARLGENDPYLAAECGVEVGSLEARQLLSGGALQRISMAARESLKTGHPAQMAGSDLDTLSRLEGVVALGSSRIGIKMAAMDAEKQQEGLAKLGSFIGLATGAVGLYKSIF